MIFNPLLGELRKRYGLSHMTFLLVCGGGTSALYPYYCTTCPDKWTEIYVDKCYFDIDPVVDVVRSGFFPVDWSSLDQRPTLTSRMFEKARSYDIAPTA